MIRRHVSEELAVLCKFQPTVLTGVDVFRFSLVGFYSRRAGYSDPRSGSRRDLTHH